MNKKKIRATYCSVIFNHETLRIIVKKLISMIRQSKLQFDSIAFRGMSGAIVAPMVAKVLKKNLICIRKSKDNSHSSFMVEGYMASEKYIIIDDFIATGATIQAIINEIDSAYKDLPSAIRSKPVGIFLYKEITLSQTKTFLINGQFIDIPTFTFHINEDGSFGEQY